MYNFLFLFSNAFCASSYILELIDTIYYSLRRSRISFYFFAILYCCISPAAVVTAGSNDKIYDVMILSQCYRSAMISERLYSIASTNRMLTTNNRITDRTTLLYTGWVILIYGPEYLPNYSIYKKMV